MQWRPLNYEQTLDEIGIISYTLFSVLLCWFMIEGSRVEDEK